MNRCIRVAASFLRKISWPAGLEVVGCSDQVVEPSAFEVEEVFDASLHFVPNVLGYRPPRALRGRRRHSEADWKRALSDQHRSLSGDIGNAAQTAVALPRVNDGRHYGEIRRKGDSRECFDTHDACIRSM